MKLAPVFYDGVSVIEDRAGDNGATSNQQQEPLDSRKWLLKLKKLRIVWNSKVVKTENSYKLGPKFCTPPDFWEGKLEQSKVIAHVYGNL